MSVIDPPFRQLVTARFTGGTNPKIAWPNDTLAGSDLLCGVLYSLSASSTITTDVASTNPTSTAWGTPIATPQVVGSGGLVFRLYRLPAAAQRFARDAATSAAFFEQLVFNASTNSEMVLIELEDVASLDVLGGSNTGSSTTLAAPAILTAAFGEYVLGFHAHRNTEDQTATAPAVFPTAAGAGNPTPIGATASPNQVSLAVTLTLPGAAGASVTPTTTIGTPRNYVALGVAFKSVSRAQPKHGVLGSRTIKSAGFAPVMLGGNTDALVGVERNWSFASVLVGPEALTPTITNLAAGNLTQTTADVSFDANPGNLQTTLRIDYTPVLGDDGTPNWLVGFSRVPLASPLSGTDTLHVVDSLSSLTAGTTYYWRVVAVNTQGETDSDPASFATLSLAEAAPTVVTGTASPLVGTAATLTGSINPQNLPTQYYFRFGTSSTLAGATSTTPQTLAAVDASAHGVAAAITGLTANTQYYFQLHAANDDAPEVSGGVDGAIVTFTTPAVAVAPVVVTGTPTAGRATRLVVAGSVDPNGASTTWKAQASTDGFSTVAAETTAATLGDSTAGNVQSVSGTITGLTAGTAYTTRITATNSTGTTNGTASSSISTEGLPTASGLASSSITSSGAHLSADVHHTGFAVSGVACQFEYGTSTSYGTTLPSTAIEVAASDSDPLTIGVDLSSLAASTTYHWRLRMLRDDGDGGLQTTSDQTFTTTAASSIPSITTPTAYGPTSAIPTGQATAATPAYTIQVAADGTLHKSSDHSAVTVSGTSFIGGTLIVESDTPGTRRTPAAGVLDQLRVHAGHLILRELVLSNAMGALEVTSAPHDGSDALTFEGCSGYYSHFRVVDCKDSRIRITKSANGVYSGHPSLSTNWATPFDYTVDPYNPTLTNAELRLDNFTAHGADGFAALRIDAALSVVIGGFDPGTLSTAAASNPAWTVRFDAAIRSGGVASDVQDVYLDAALDGTASITCNSGTTNAASARWGACKRCGIWAATHPNTSGSRPAWPAWFDLANGTLPSAATAVNTTNDQVIAEAIVSRNWLCVNTVNATFRDGSTKAQAYEICCEVYDPAVALTLWTPDDLVQSWPNGAKRFISADGVRRTFGPRPTLAATMPGLPATAYQNKAAIDASWTHMGGIDGDGVTVIKDVVFDPDGMVGTTLYTQDVTSGAAVTVKTAVTVSLTTPVTLSVQAPGGGPPDLSLWLNTKNIAAGQKTITSISNATPPVVTATGHGYATGDKVTITGSSVSAYNAEWTITFVSANTFSLNGGTAAGAATGGKALSRASIYGIYTGYVDANLGANGVDTGIGYRRQLSYTGVDTAAGAFTGVLLVPGPTSTPAPAIGSANATPTIGGDILKIAAGVVESFFPHGLPTGDTVTVTGVPGLSGSYTVTRVDAFHFSLNGQSGFSWTPTLGTIGAYTPTTPHAYGLAGTQTSFSIPVGTTLDSTQNPNYGQLSNNASINIANGARLRFVRCGLKNIGVNFLDSTAFVEFIDCDHSVTPLPGKYDYDSPGNLGVAGTYDRFNQYLPARIQVNLNVFAVSQSRVRLTRMVLTGAHGDVLPGQWGAGSEWNEVYIDQASPAGTNGDNSSNTRPGIGTQNMPKVAHMTHGDIAQYFEFSTALMRKCHFHTQGHSITFSRLGDHYEAHTAMIVMQATDKSGTLASPGALLPFYKLVLADVDRFSHTPTAGKGFQNVGPGDTILVKNAGALTGAWLITDFTDKDVVGSKTHYDSIILNAPYPIGGAGASADMAHAVNIVYPGILRCRFGTQKYTDSGDTMHLTPIQAKGNVTISITTQVGSSPSAPIPGELDYRLTLYDSGVDNGGSFNLSNPGVHTEWIDLGSPNRNAFTIYASGTFPGATATPTYVST